MTTPDWLIPALWSVLVGIIAWVVKNLSEVSRNLAVTTTRLEDHGRRIERIEDVHTNLTNRLGGCDA